MQRLFGLSRDGRGRLPMYLIHNVMYTAILGWELLRHVLRRRLESHCLAVLRQSAAWALLSLAELGKCFDELYAQQMQLVSVLYVGSLG